MSFGFSAGDFLAVAELAYQLSKALSDSNGATKQYQELIAILNVVHKVLLQVEQLRAANQLAQATVNALLFTVNSTNVIMEAFLGQNAAYNKSLKPGGSGNSVSDMFQKGKWAIQMPDKIRTLQKSLGTMLAAINCLVSLACHYNWTELEKIGRHARLTPNNLSWASKLSKQGNTWQGIRITAQISRPEYEDHLSGPWFAPQRDPRPTFRPGLIFTTEITSTLRLTRHGTSGFTDFGHLPLSEGESEGRQERLDEIRQLPLDKMTHYCETVPNSGRRVYCLLCSRTGKPCTYLKDDWATRHFRLYHWQYYMGMIPELYQALIPEEKEAEIIPWEKQIKQLSQPVGRKFSAEIWITLEDVIRDTPISGDGEILGFIKSSSLGNYLPFGGPIMIQRFVVVREGWDQCLALGIHTYARHGCGHQPDQELFGVLSTEKQTPPLQPDETGIILSPVRMKPDHPSLTLPSTARIHYGRSYVIDHNLLIQPLGLVHPASMETLLDQFERNVGKLTADELNYELKRETMSCKAKNDDTGLEPENEPKHELKDGHDPLANIEPAEAAIVRSMRDSITEVLGPRLAPQGHTPPMGSYLLGTHEFDKRF